MTTQNGAGQPLSADSSLDPELLDGLWDFDDPSASEQRFRLALDDVRTGSTAWAELTTQLARSIGLQGRFDEAGALLDAVAATVPAATIPAATGPATTGPDSAVVARIRLSLERGRLLNSSGEPSAAVEQFTDAWLLAQDAGDDFLAIDAAHMLAIADRGSADEWTGRALRAVARSTDARTQRWAGSLHNNAGWARHDAGDYAAALEEFQAALTAYSANGTVEQVRVARWAVARALRSLARFDEALQIQLRLAAHGPSDGYVEEELAELLLATGRPDEASRHAATAAQLLGADSWFAEYEPGRLERLRHIARPD